MPLCGAFTARVTRAAENRSATKSTSRKSTKGIGNISCSSSAPMAMMPMPKELLDLNDDCLFNIFKVMDFEHLIAVRHTCRRFREIADNLFRIYHSRINLTDAPVDGYSTPSQAAISMSFFSALCTNFGQHIRHLRIAEQAFPHTDHGNAIIKITTHCTGLKSLYLHGLQFPDWADVGQAACFASLENLTLRSCHLNASLQSLLQSCDNLRELSITGRARIAEPIFVVAMPRLESAEFVVQDGMDLEVFSTFLALNAQLRRLRHHCGITVTDDILGLVAGMPQLQALDIRIAQYANFNDSVMQLLRLPHLTELHINCQRAQPTRFVRSLAERGIIQQLRLDQFAYDNELIDEIGQCPNLVDLAFGSVSGLTVTAALYMARRLRSVKKLSFLCCGALRANMCLALIENATRLQELVLVACGFVVQRRFIEAARAFCTQRDRPLTLDISHMPAHLDPDIMVGRSYHLHIEFPLYGVESDELDDLENAVVTDDNFGELIGLKRSTFSITDSAVGRLSLC